MTRERDITVSDLEIMTGALYYRKWLYSAVEPFLGRRVLEVGAGIGNYSEFLIGHERVVLVELHAEAAKILRQKFSNLDTIKIIEGDICTIDPALLEVEKLDTVLCLNVLEHILDDDAALRVMRQSLVKGGRLAIIVPAHPFLFGTVDRAVGHVRRYTRKGILDRVKAAGFVPERVCWMNFLGIAAWFFTNRILCQKEESPSQIGFYNRFVAPCVRNIERFIPPPFGLSIVLVARRAE
jgi:SAM-dependent methyltransferase